MKKILLTLGTIAMTIGSTTMVLSCGTKTVKHTKSEIEIEDLKINLKTLLSKTIGVTQEDKDNINKLLAWPIKVNMENALSKLKWYQPSENPNTKIVQSSLSEEELNKVSPSTDLSILSKQGFDKFNKALGIYGRNRIDIETKSIYSWDSKTHSIIIGTTGEFPRVITLKPSGMMNLEESLLVGEAKPMTSDMKSFFASVIKTGQIKNATYQENVQDNDSRWSFVFNFTPENDFVVTKANGDSETLETNVPTSIIVDFDSPSDKILWNDKELKGSKWTELLVFTAKLHGSI